MERVLESNRAGDIRHAKILVSEETGGAMHPGLENILHGGHAKVVAKQFSEVLPRKSRLFRHISHGKHAGRIAVHPDLCSAEVFRGKVGVRVV